MKITKLFKAFYDSEKAGGLILIACTIISLLLANSGIGNGYTHFWHTKLGGLSIEHWINDALMAIFFLLIGLELEREIYVGELSHIKDALLPLSAAIGGIIFPVLLYLSFNINTPTQSGSGIAMATDIAFALGILSLFGNRVPTSLKVFLTALAVIDDLGAIIIISIFYTKTLIWAYLIAALGIFGGLLILNRLKIYSLIPYLIGGVAMWYCMLHSGVHATITGVLLAFAIPFKGGDNCPSYKLQNFLHTPVAFIILPIFALANTAIMIKGNIGEILTHNYSIGIALGLILGKPIGITLFGLLSIKLKWAKLPMGMTIKRMIGIGFLGGIGFTMSIFITLLAFEDATIINNTKLVVLLSSLVAGTIGYIILSRVLNKTRMSVVKTDVEEDV